jgi:hypothetical protein
MSTSLFVEDSFSIKPKDLLAETLVKPGISYWYEDPEDWSVWSISVNGSDPQEIKMEWEPITFGDRPYFRCECSRRASKLYLPPNGHEFKCRDCHNLSYQLASFNRHSPAGRKLYQVNRLNKLSNNRAGMSRIFYEGKYTKRFERFLRQCERAGFNSIVEGANALKKLVMAD